MDFHSLPRRDLQFFCKKNKIPANMTNIAMADALKALEIVEGIDEFVNQSESTRDQSPTSIARNLPSAARTAARTTRRKATKDETQTSELVTRSCYVPSKSLAGEMDQENKNTNMPQNPSLPHSRRREAATSVAVKLDVPDIMPEANESKTPAARSTRKAQAAASSKKTESVQRVYSTRRAVKLLEESMADLCLKTKEKSVNVPAMKEDSPAGSELQEKSYENSEKTEVGVMSVRDLNDSMEKECDGSKDDPDLNILYGDLGDITFFDANTSKEQMNGTGSNTVTASDSFVLVSKQETSQEEDSVVVDQAAPAATTHAVACIKESESEEMKIDSPSESDETEYETDPSEGDNFGVAVDTNEEAFESKVTASDNVSKVDATTTVLIADESEENKPEEEMICESGELTDSEPEEALVSDKKKTQASSSSFSPFTEKEREANSDDDEWSEFEPSDIESEEAPVSDKKTPASSSTLAGKESKTPSSPFEGESLSESDNKNKENVVEMVVDNNGEGKATEGEAKKKKKTTDEENLKDVSKRQLTKMLKEKLALKSNKQKHKCSE